MAHTDPARLPGRPQATILILCTGNICRSAYAEQELRAGLRRLGAAAPRVISRGTRVNSGLRTPRELLEAAGKNAEGLQYRVPEQLTDQDVRSASIILAASGEHLTDALQRVPAKMRRAFTLAEFAHAARFQPAAPGAQPFPDQDWLSILQEHASARRSEIRAELRGRMDIPDPYGHSSEAYASMVATVDRHIAEIAGFALAQTRTTASNSA